MEIDLGQLTGRDIGRTVTIRHRGTSITGMLTDFQINTDWITETSYGQRPDDGEQVPGRRTVGVTVGPWSAARLPMDAVVEIER